MKRDRKLILITGITCAGKTTLSEQLSSNSLHIDFFHSYVTKETNYGKLISVVNQLLLDENIVLDGYLHMYDPQLSRLREMLSEVVGSIEVLLIYTDMMDLYQIQVHKNRTHKGYVLGDELEVLEKNIDVNTKICVGMNEHFKRLLYQKVIDKLTWIYRKGGEYTYYESDEHFYTVISKGKEIMNSAIEEKGKELLQFIDKTSGDPKYQTIELNGEVIRKGYAECWKSWENINKTGILWEGKSVCDLGCFNGYYCFKIEKAGAKEVVGYDRNGAALTISGKIAELTNSKCLFVKKEIGEPYLFDRKFDVILALNFLHHVEEEKGLLGFRRAIEAIFTHSNEVIFEVNEKEIFEISDAARVNGFSLIARIESHRKTQFGNRFILYFVKR